MCNLVSNGTKVCSSNFLSIPYTTYDDNDVVSEAVVHKGQIVSEAIFLGFKSPKKPTKFQRFSALASKNGSNKIKEALYSIITP